jgi:hypothetical protein
MYKGDENSILLVSLFHFFQSFNKQFIYKAFIHNCFFLPFSCGPEIFGRNSNHRIDRSQCRRGPAATPQGNESGQIRFRVSQVPGQSDHLQDQGSGQGDPGGSLQP